MIMGFTNSVLAISSVLCACVAAAQPSAALNPSGLKSGGVELQNASKAILTAPKIQSQKSVKKLDEKSADWLDMSLQDVSGKTTTLRHWLQAHTKPVLLVLSATWCPPCMHELPFLASMQKTLADKLDVLIVFVDEIMNSDQKNPQLKPSLQKFNRGEHYLRLHYASDASMVMRKNNLLGLPSFLLFSPNGSVLHTSTGAKQWDNASVQNELLNHTKESHGSAGTVKDAVQKGPQNKPMKKTRLNQSVMITPSKG